MNKTIMILVLLISVAFLNVSAEAGITADTIFYGTDKSITLYGNVNASYQEFGFEIVSGDMQGKCIFRAYGDEGEDGSFAVRISDTAIAGRNAFDVRAYGITENGEKQYSEELLNVDKASHYSRKPLLKNVNVSSGALYPEFSPDVYEYYIVLDEFPDGVPEIKFEKENADDSVEYLKAENLNEVTEIRLNSGFSESTYKFRCRMKKSAEIKADKLMIKEEAKVSGDVLDIKGNESISLNASATAYIGFDVSALPEKYIPVCLSVNLDEAFNVYKCIERGWSEKEAGSYYDSYTLQTEAALKSSGILDETLFRTRRDFSLALKVKEDKTFSSDIRLHLEYFDDTYIPSFNGAKSNADIASLQVDGANELYPAFSPEITEYYAVYDKLPGTVPKVNASAVNSETSVEVTSEDDTVLIKAISSDGTNEKLYTIKLREYKFAEMKLSDLAGKRTPYELFDMAFPMTSGTPYYSYVCMTENKYGTNYSHITTMAFDTSMINEENIVISSAELVFLATTNCTEGSEFQVYRSVNTTWDTDDAQKQFFKMANHFVPVGKEGKLNDKTVISATDGNLKIESYRNYRVPLNTEGFTDGDSVNLICNSKWQDKNPPDSAYQNIYIWLGKYRRETQSGLGYYPTVELRYFSK